MADLLHEFNLQHGQAFSCFGCVEFAFALACTFISDEGLFFASSLFELLCAFMQVLGRLVAGCPVAGEGGQFCTQFVWQIFALKNDGGLAQSSIPVE